MGYTSDDLISRVRLWSASSTGTPPSVEDADLLDILNQEMGSVVVPLIMQSAGEWLVDYDDVAISHADDVQAITVPTRAVLGKLREVKIYDGGTGRYFNLPALTVAQLEDVKGQTGVYFVGDTLYLLDAKRWPDTYVVRMFYYRRPNDLVLSASASTVSTVGGSTFTIANAESIFTTSATLDFVQPRPPFSLVASDVACTISGNTVTPTTMPTGVTAGDYVALAGYSAIPMIPLEYHGILCQGATLKVLEVSADANAVQMAGAKYRQMVDSIKPHAANRVSGEAQVFKARGRLF